MDSLEKITFTQDLLADMEYIEDASDAEDVYKKLGRGHLITVKNNKASKRIEVDGMGFKCAK